MRQSPILLLFIFDPLDAEVDVWPIESGDEQLRPLEAKQRDDIVAHFGRRGRGERGDWWSAARAIARLAKGGGGRQPPIIGTEIVAPLGHAVRFVHDEP